MSRWRVLLVEGRRMFAVDPGLTACLGALVLVAGTLTHVPGLPVPAAGGALLGGCLGLLVRSILRAGRR